MSCHPLIVCRQVASAELEKEDDLISSLLAEANSARDEALSGILSFTR